MDGRSNFSRQEVEILAKRAGYRCSNPSCRKYTCGPHSDDNRAVNLGEAAHIVGASWRGPRGSAELCTEERGGIENSIWLCRICHKRIDDEPDQFTAKVLLQWKQIHEDWMRSVVFDERAEVQDREQIRRLFLSLEDRRILFSARTGHTIASHMVLKKLDASGCLSKPHFLM